jgi:hypothetical protein
MSSYEYDKTNKPKMSQEERDRLLQEFLTKGGEIKKLKPGIAQGASSLNRNKNLQLSYKEIIEQDQNKK